MADVNDFLTPFSYPELAGMLEATQEREIAPDVWQFDGNLGLDFFLAAPSSNFYILRDGDIVVLFDTGMHPYYRRKILDKLAYYKEQGAKTLVLLNSQGHWDHCMQNSVVLEAGYDEVRFLLPEPEVPVIDSIGHWLNDFRRLAEFYSAPAEWLDLLVGFETQARNSELYGQYEDVWQTIKQAQAEPTEPNVYAAIKRLCERVLFSNFRSLAEIAEVLPLDSRERRTYGSVEVEGWQVGRFFVIHDASHSPGHLCLYDPLNKLILSGDVTIEINPAFGDTNWKRLIKAARAFRIMSQEGFIELATDSHRNEDGFKLIIAFTGMEPLDETELMGVMRGSDQCASFFGAFENYYVNLRDEVLTIHRRLGECTMEDILAELRKSDNRYVKFKMALPFPSRPEVLVYRVLKEYGYSLREVDGKKLLSPPRLFDFNAKRGGKRDEVQLDPEEVAQQAYEFARDFERENTGCAQSCLAGIYKALNLEDDSLFKAASGLSDGMGLTTNGTCGALTAGALVLGHYFGRTREQFEDPLAAMDSYDIVKDLHDQFLDRVGAVRCGDIQKKIAGRSFDLRNPDDLTAAVEAGMSDHCAEVAGIAAEIACRIIAEET